MSEAIQVGEQKAARPVHWLTLAQFAGSAAAALTLLGLAVALVIAGLLQLFTPQVGLALATPSLLNASGMLLVGGLLAPSAGYALLRLVGRRAAVLGPEARWHTVYRPGLWLLALPLVVGVGFGASFVPWLAFFVLPPLHLLGMSLPVFWLVWLARRNLVNDAPQMFWGVLAGGLTLGPLLILLTQFVVVVGGVLVFGLYLATHPALLQAGLRIQDYMEAHPLPEMEALLELLLPFLADKGIAMLLFIGVAVVVPLVEEALKPVALWLLAGRNLTGAQGFAAGALSGAGFALFENVTRGVGAEEWTLLVIARSGTALLHIFTSGLVGYGMALAWRERAYIKLGLAYLAAVAIHGLWNGAAVAMALAALPATLAGATSPVGLYWLAAGPLTLALLFGGMLALLLWGNRALRTPVVAAEPAPES